MPIEPVKIPQNVQIEDRIIGPLSLRQIIIMALGAGFSYMLYAVVQRTYGYVNIPLTAVLWTPAVIAAAFALVKINDLSLLRICFLFLERLQKPSERTWGPRSGISITIRTSALTAQEQPKTNRGALPDKHDEIATLSTVVDQHMPIAQAEPETVVETEPPAPVAETVSAPRPPVNPDRIQVDSPAPAAKLSDLSVFRDVFPPTSTWHQ
jgi:hypothetical protein